MNGRFGCVAVAVLAIALGGMACGDEDGNGMGRSVGGAAGDDGGGGGNGGDTGGSGGSGGEDGDDGDGKGDDERGGGEELACETAAQRTTIACYLCENRLMVSCGVDIGKNCESLLDVRLGCHEGCNCDDEDQACIEQCLVTCDDVRTPFLSCAQEHCAKVRCL